MGGDAHSCAYCSLCYRCVWSMVLVLIGVRHMASKQCGFSGGEGGLDGLSSLHSFEGFCVLR